MSLSKLLRKKQQEQQQQQKSQYAWEQVRVLVPLELL